MFHLNSAGRLMGRNDASQDLDRLHRVALHEAKVAAHQHRIADAATALSQQRRRFRSTPIIR